MKRLRGKVTYANVVSTLCLFLLLGGGAAFAANRAKNSVGTKQLKKNSVTTAKIRKNAVATAKLRKEAVATAKLKAAAVTGAKLADGAVTSAKLSTAAVGTAQLADGGVTDSKLASKYLAAGTVGVPVAGANLSKQRGPARLVQHQGRGTGRCSHRNGSL